MVVKPIIKITNKTKNNLVGFEERLYIDLDHTQVWVSAGMEISYTMRKVLGSPKIKDEDRPKF